MSASSEQDHYVILGIPQTSADEEIRQAWKKLALTSRPDRNPGNPEATAQFQKVMLSPKQSLHTVRHGYNQGADRISHRYNKPMKSFWILQLAASTTPNTPSSMLGWPQQEQTRSTHSRLPLPLPRALTTQTSSPRKQKLTKP